MRKILLFIIVIVLAVQVIAPDPAPAGEEYPSITQNGITFNYDQTQQMYIGRADSGDQYALYTISGGQTLLTNLRNINQYGQYAKEFAQTKKIVPAPAPGSAAPASEPEPTAPAPESSPDPNDEEVPPQLYGEEIEPTDLFIVRVTADTAARISREVGQSDRAFVYLDVNGNLKTAVTPLPPPEPGTAPAAPTTPAPALPVATVSENGVFTPAGAYMGMQIPANVLPSLVREGAEYQFIRSSETPRAMVERARAEREKTQSHSEKIDFEIEQVNPLDSQRLDDVSAAQSALDNYGSAKHRFAELNAKYDQNIPGAFEELSEAERTLTGARDRVVRAQTALDNRFDESILAEPFNPDGTPNPKFSTQLSELEQANNRLRDSVNADIRAATAVQDAARRELAAAETALQQAERNARNPVVLRIMPETTTTTDKGTLVSNRVKTTTGTEVHSDGSVTRITEQEVSNCGIGCDDSKANEFVIRSRSRDVDRTQDITVKDKDGNDVVMSVTFRSERSVNNIPLIGGIEEFGSSERVYWEPPTPIPPLVFQKGNNIPTPASVAARNAALADRQKELQDEYARDESTLPWIRGERRNRINKLTHINHKDANEQVYLVYDPETDEYYDPADTDRKKPLDDDAIEKARGGATVNVDDRPTKASNVLLAQSRMKRNEDREAAKGRTAFGLFKTGDVGGGVGRLMKIYNEWSGLTSLSNLIWDKNAIDVQERRQKMIQEFCLAGGIENCLVSTICGQVHEITPSNVIAGRGPGGQFISSGVINAERSFPIDIRGLSRQQLIDILGRNITTIQGIRVDLSNPSLNLSRFGNITLRLYHIQVSVTNNVAGEKDLRYNVELRRTGAQEAIRIEVPATGTTPATIEEGQVEFPTAYGEPISQAKIFKKDRVLKPTETTPPDERHEYFNSFAEWDTACLLVQPGLPKGTALDSSFGREFCTPIKEYRGGPTTISPQEAQTQAPANVTSREADSAI